MSSYFIDLFCGAGGLSLGFENAGFKCAAAIDNFEAAIETHHYNFPNSLSICDDIKNINPKNLKKDLSHDIDLIIGGPPCPTFSTIGHAKIQSLNREVYKDERNKLFIDFLKYVEIFQPKFFVMENVPNFMTKYKGEVFNSALNLIKSIKGDYIISNPVQILNAANYGVPQKRRRMFLVGHKPGYDFQYPEETHMIKSDGKQQELFNTNKKLPYNTTVFPTCT